MSERWAVAVTGGFSAAHALRNYQGKCERLHGHNFTVEVRVEGRGLDGDTGILLDFRTLKGLLAEALAELDHQDLNSLPQFSEENPSSELLGRHIWRRLESLLAQSVDRRAGMVSLKSVTVSEKPGQSATYLGPGD